MITSLHERCYIGLSPFWQRLSPSPKQKHGGEKPTLETKGKVKWQSTTSHKKGLPKKATLRLGVRTIALESSVGVVSPLAQADTFLSCKRKDVGTHGIEAVQSLSMVWLHET